MTITNAERFPPLTPEVIAARDAKRAALAELLDAAPKTLRAVTTEAIYDVHPPVPLLARPGRVVVAIRVRVTRQLAAQPVDRGVTVHAEHRARNASGRPRANGAEWCLVPDSLAGDLIVRALRS